MIGKTISHYRVVEKLGGGGMGVGGITEKLINTLSRLPKLPNLRAGQRTMHYAEL